MRKVVSLFILALFVSLVAFSAVEVEFWHAMGSGQGEAIEEIVKMFNDQNKDIVIKPVYIGNYGALNQKLLASVQSNTLPVISQAYGNWTSKLLESSIVENLNPYLNDSEIGMTQEEWEDIWLPFRQICTWGDNVYAIPFNKSIYVMYYNNDVLDMEGIDVPTTFEEIYDMTKALTVDEDGDGNIDQYGFAFRSTIDTFAIFLLNNGGTIVNENADGTYDITLDSPEARETLEFLKKMKDENIAFVQGGYLNGPFGEGKVIAYVDTIAGKSYVDSSCKGKHDWQWAKIPSGKSFNPPFAGTDVIMFTSATDEQKAAAWKFMKFLASPKVTTFWAMKTGYLPVRESALDTPEWKTYTKLEPKAAVPVSFVKEAYSDPKPATWYEIRSVVGDMFNNVLFEKYTIDEGIEWAVKEIKSYLDM